MAFGHGGIFNALTGKVFRNCEIARYAWPCAPSLQTVSVSTGIPLMWFDEPAEGGLSGRPSSFPPPPQQSWKDADPRGSIHTPRKPKL